MHLPPSAFDHLQFGTALRKQKVEASQHSNLRKRKGKRHELREQISVRWWLRIPSTISYIPVEYLYPRGRRIVRFLLSVRLPACIVKGSSGLPTLPTVGKCLERL
jgi:hypothetical protein